ncbi:MAG: glutamine--tRNA ligase, partial [Desulfitobacteriaceae bacterium]
LHPLKVIIDNYPADQVEELTAENNPENPEMGSRRLPFSRELYIEREDFMENPPKKFFRLSLGQEVRLKHAFIIKCVDVIKDEKTGEIVELRCTYDSETRSGGPASGRKVKGTLHWVSAAQALTAQVRLYEYLLLEDGADVEGESQDLETNLNPHSLEILTTCQVEPSLAGASPGEHFQFLRHGYFCVDADSQKGDLIFNRTVSLRDTWGKIVRNA